MGFKLLIVDDEPIVRRGILQLVDYSKLQITEVLDACDGLEALKLAKTFNPDIVIADINMPNMDGLTFAKQLKKTLPTVHIIIATGYDQYEYTREAMRIGVDDYVLKPLSRSEIEKLLKETTDKLISDNKNNVINEALLDIAKNKDLNFDTSLNYKKKIIDNIEKQYMLPSFSFNQLSNSLNLSNGYLSRLFRQIFGVTFQEYLSELRLEHGRILIIGTEMKIYIIAEKCGYSDPNYFSTAFKKKYAMSPNQYREFIKGGGHENQ